PTGSGHLDDPRDHGLRVHPVRAAGFGVRPLDPAAGDRPAGGGAVHPGALVDRGLRHRAGGLVIGLDLFAAGWGALDRAGDLLRGRDGPVVRDRVPLRRNDVHVADRVGPGPGLVRLLAVAVVHDLPGVHGRRDQPGAVRPARGRR